jgi:hypothetical protein
MDNPHCPLCHLVFQSAEDEIKWHLHDADLGHTWAQHRVGALYLAAAETVEDLIQAYKWLFTCVALGDVRAREELVEVMDRLDRHQTDEAHGLVEDWFNEKIEDVAERDEALWAPELMRWRFELSRVH